MPNLPNGRYGITVASWDISFSGVLDTTTTPPTYQGVAVSNFNSASGSIGWTSTVNGTTVTFSTGTYNAGPPATVTGGSASASGQQNTSWAVNALGNGSYTVTVTNNNATAGGRLVVSGQPGSQSATYRFGNVGASQSCSNLDLTSGQIGWQVSDASGTGFTFSNGVYIPLQGEPHLIFGGNVSFPTTVADQDSWTADASTGGTEHPHHKHATHKG